MSAIAGIVHFDKHPLDQSELKRMEGGLSILGDGKSRYMHQRTAGFIAQNSHITPEDLFDRQPLTLGRDGVLLFHGLITNRDEVIPQLGLTSLKSSMYADSQLAALAWQKWQSSLTDHLIGPYTIVHWDSSNTTLTIISGAPSGRPLYMYHSQNSLYFSSTPQALFSLPHIPQEMCEDALADTLLHTPLPNGSSFFKNISTLPPAHRLIFTPKGKSSQRYWEPPSESTLEFNSEEECWEAFNELFEKVVSSHIRSIAPVGIQMSGGHDSGSIAAQAAILLGKEGKSLHGYTRIPSDEVSLPPDGQVYYNERSRVEKIKEMYPNLITNFIEVSDEPMFDGLSHQFSTLYQFYYISSSFVTGDTSLYQRAKQDGVKALLLGTCGNATISYNGHTRLRSLLRSGHLPTLASNIIKLKKNKYASNGHIKKELFNSLLGSPLRKPSRTKKGNHSSLWDGFSSINPDFAESSGARQRLQEKSHRGLDFYSFSSSQRRQWCFLHNQSRHSISLAESLGLELREPAGDRRIVEFCLKLPDHYFLNKGIDRRLARLGMANLLPESIRLSPAKGKQDVDWAHRAMQDSAAITSALNEAANNPDITKYLDVERMKKLWEKLQKQGDVNSLSVQQQVLFKQGLFGTLNAAKFIQWLEGGNR